MGKLTRRSFLGSSLLATSALAWSACSWAQVGGANTMDTYQGTACGVIIHCEGGHVAVPGYAATGTVAYDRQGREVKRWTGTEDHFANFIRAVRSRRHQDLHADILEGHLSSGLCHQGNLSYRLGRRADPDEAREALRKDAAAEETLDRMETHLAANHIDLRLTPLTLGPTLRFNPKTGQCFGHPSAVALLSRPYRPGSVVPKKV